MSFNLLDSVNKESDCKGKVFRYTLSAYQASDGSFQQREVFKLLKRKSCSGCQQCDWVEGHIIGYIDENGPLPKLDEFWDGDLAYYHLHDYLSYYGEYDIYEEGCIDPEIDYMECCPDSGIEYWTNSGVSVTHWCHIPPPPKYHYEVADKYTKAAIESLDGKLKDDTK